MNDLERLDKLKNRLQSLKEQHDLQHQKLKPLKQKTYKTSFLQK